MEKDKNKTTVAMLKTDSIERNPENPRLIFNEKEMLILLQSIDEVGILVPLIVFPTGQEKYILLDGERRLRCARRLNLETVPVNIIAKPDKIENILRMFNIHTIREQWKLMPTALKLKVLVNDKSFEGKNRKEISRLTGLSVSTVDRCLELLDLPNEHQKMILDYYKKGQPSDFRFTEDFFLEMNRAIKSIKKFQRDIYEKYTQHGLINKFVEKRKANAISDVIDFRIIPEIIGATRKGATDSEVKKELIKIIEDTNYTVQDAYEKVAEPVIAAQNIENLSNELMQQIASVSKERLESLSKRENFKSLLLKLKSTVDSALEGMEIK